MVEAITMKKCFSQKGAALVEFAIVLLPLMLITFGIIEFGLIMFNQQVITNAAREGARYGIVMTDGKPANVITQAMIQQVATNYAASHLVTFGAGNLVSTASQVCGPGTFSQSLTVTVTYDYVYLLIDNFLPLGNKKTLVSQAVMRCE
jgi:Flp pilus assembly protein TadG